MKLINFQIHLIEHDFILFKKQNSIITNRYICCTNWKQWKNSDRYYFSISLEKYICIKNWRGNIPNCKITLGTSICSNNRFSWVIKYSRIDSPIFQSSWAERVRMRSCSDTQTSIYLIFLAYIRFIDSIYVEISAH
jgi:hypothetical protein